MFVGLVSSIDKQKQNALAPQANDDTPQANNEFNMPKENHDKVGGLERREFIKLGAAGVAVSLAECALPGKQQQLPSAGSDATTVEPAVQEAGKAPPPEVGDLIDPAFVRTETWQEPWTWRPEFWPGANLELNLVENQNLGNSPSPGNPTPALFSYNGTSPGPTVRVRSDGTLLVKVRNTLGLNENQTPVGPTPDAFEFTPDVRKKVCSLAEAQVLGGDPENPRRCAPVTFPEQVRQIVPTETRPGWDLGGHVNGQHAAHTTNLHTHGLHVFPQSNPDGTHSDNVL